MTTSIKRKNWLASFNLNGVPKINDFTFKIDEKSEKSAWIYNSLNLGVDCGEKYGTVYCEMMGGYSDERENVIYVHGKNEDGSDDWEAQMTVDWEDRFNPDILETVGDACFLTVGLEKMDKGKTFFKKFLSAYDAIAYIKEHLTENMVINVRGSLKYSEYQGKTQVHKNINRITLSKVDNASDYSARFTQSILINSESVSLKNIDKDKGVVYVNAKILDYLKEKNGIEIKGQYPFDMQFEFRYPSMTEKVVKGVNEKLFKVKRGWTQITLEGELIEGGAIVTATWDDVPQDIKDLVEVGVFTEEEALSRCSDNPTREQRMVLTKPTTKKNDDGGTDLQIFPEMYKDEDLILDVENNIDEGDEDIDDSNSESSDAGDLDWLNKLP